MDSWVESFSVSMVDSWLIPGVGSGLLRVRVPSAVEEDCGGQRWRSHTAWAIEPGPGPGFSANGLSIGPPQSRERLWAASKRM